MMKRILVIIVACIALLVSIFYNLMFMDQLDTAKANIDASNTLLEEIKEDKESIEEAFLLSKSKLKSTEEDYESTKEQLAISDETLNVIDEKLNADGNLLQTIDKMLAENSQLQDELTSMTMKVTALENYSSEDQIGPEVAPVFEEAPFDVTQWVNDIDAILAFIDSRKSDLDTAVSTLPPLSLERIMINQEIAFLDDTMAEIVLLQDDISSITVN